MKKIIIFDFDGTLTPYSLPKFEILKNCGMQDGALNPKFMQMVNSKVKLDNVDLYEAIYQTYFEIIKNAGFLLTDENFCLGANSITYNKDVFKFLSYLNDNDIKIYIVSSGIKVYLEKTSIYKFCTNIYASTFNYNNKKEAIGTKYIMSDKNKVEAIKDIIKTLGINKNNCEDIIYIGDGITDYYAMKYVKENKGTSICVYQDEFNKDLEFLKKEQVIDFSAYVDYSSNSELTNYIKNKCNLKDK